MDQERISPIVMPKWGLSMVEGKLTSWLVAEGSAVEVGQAILEIETDKIAGTVESTRSGILRRRVGEPDVVYPVKTLLGVIAETSVLDTEIDAYLANYVVPAADAGEEEAGPSYEFLDVAAGKVRYAKRGSGKETILLIHGFGGDLDNWLFNIDAFGEIGTVYALDLPGHGQSTKAIADPTLKGLASSVIEFMSKVGVDRAHLIGHSLGGAIAMSIAQIEPSKVQSLSLISPVGLGRDINYNYIVGFINSASRRDLKPVLELLFADPSLVSRKMVDDILKFKRLDGVDTALKGLVEAIFKDGRQQNMLDMAGKPTLVIWGKEDKILPHAHASNAKGVAVEIIEGAGHMAQMEKAAHVNALIKAHLARLDH